MPSTSVRTWQQFGLFVLCLFASGKVVDTCLDWDTWWHLRVGQFISSTGQLPASEPFSQTGQEKGTVWIAYSWIYELILYATFTKVGVTGILAFKSILVMLSWSGFAWYLFHHCENRWRALLLLALVTIALRPFATERPWHFTILFTTLTLHAVVQVRSGAPLRRYYGLFPLYVIWANIHIQFVLGFAILGLGWLVAWIEARRSGRPDERARVPRLFFLGLGCSQ